MARTIYNSYTTTQTTSTSTTPTSTNASVTFTPDANTTYYIFASCEASTSTTSGDGIDVAIHVAGTKQKSLVYRNAAVSGSYWKDASDVTHHAGIYYWTSGGSPSSTVFDLRVARPGGTGTATFEGGQIIVIKKETGDFETTTSFGITTSATYVDILTTTQTTADDIVIFSDGNEFYNTNTSATVHDLKAVNDGTSYGELVKTNSSLFGYVNANNWFNVVPYTGLGSSSRTYKIQARSDGTYQHQVDKPTIIGLKMGSGLSIVSGSSYDETDYTDTNALSDLGSHSISKSTSASGTAMVFAGINSNNDSTTRSHLYELSQGGSLWGAVTGTEETYDGRAAAVHPHGWVRAYTGTGSSLTNSIRFGAEAGASNTHTVYSSFLVMLENVPATNYSLAADAGSYTYTGQAATPAYGRSIAADAGSYTYTGLDATFTRDINLTADAGSYTYSGLDAGLQRGWNLAADAGTYTYSGLDATFARGKSLAADAGSYTYTGLDATFTRGINLAADAGTYTYTGLDATINRGINLAADAGSYTYTGLDPAINRGINLSVDAGSYTFTGFDVTIDYVSTGTATETTDVAGPPKLVKRSAYEDRDKKRKALKDAIDRAMNPETPQDEAADAIAEVAEIAEIAMPDLPAAPFSEMLAVMATMDREINRAYQRAIDDAVAVILLSME